MIHKSYQQWLVAAQLAQSRETKSLKPRTTYVTGRLLSNLYFLMPQESLT